MLWINPLLFYYLLWQHLFSLPPHLPSLLSSFQLLLNLLQRRVASLRHGGVEFWHAIKGRGLENDLKGLARCPLVYLNHLHIFDDAPAQVHSICGVVSRLCQKNVQIMNICAFSALSSFISVCSSNSFSKMKYKFWMRISVTHYDI